MVMLTITITLNPPHSLEDTCHGDRITREAVDRVEGRISRININGPIQSTIWQGGEITAINHCSEDNGNM